MAAPPTATAAAQPRGPMPEPGAVVAGYRLESLIAEGETALVYEATKPSLEQTVALTLFDSRLSADAGFRERFQREGRIQTAIDHPNVATVFEVGESEYGLFVAVELLRAGSLQDLIAREKLETGRTVRIVRQVADALDTIHSAGLVHGDIRPKTILVRTEGLDHAYLTGFGVAEPERMDGEPGTAQGDISDLGAVLSACLAGDIPSELDPVVSIATAESPADRYDTAAELVQALELAVAPAESEAVTPGTAVSAPAAEPAETAAPARGSTGDAVSSAGPARRRSLFWAVATAAVLALAAAGFIVGRGASAGKTATVSSPAIRANGVRLKIPVGWHHLTKVPSIPGVTFPGAIALATPTGTAKLIAAPVDGEWPTLLPASFEQRASSESDLLDRREVVLLGRRQAFRYRDVSLEGNSARLTVFVLPDRGRVEMLTCALTTGAAVRLGRQCAGVAAAAAVNLPKSKPYSLLPPASYANALSAAVDRLNHARVAGRRELAAAGTVSEQALAARRVGAAFAREAARLKKRTTGPLVTPLNRKIVAQMARVRAAYESLASAALEDQETSFTEAKQLVRLREAGLKKLFLELRAAGISTK